tara:strand:- start:4209 stop:4958 length:750 start_codon:yes stop_codon:yes gene_type:complete
MLEIKGLHVSVQGSVILNGLDLTVPEGEVHAIMGPNGSGKSTLSYTMAGREGYVATDGQILYRGVNLLKMSPEDRAREGMFMAFQYPVEIPGVSVLYFLKAALNAHRKHRGEKEVDAIEFLKLARSNADTLGMDHEMLNRQVNMGFSGGEKKRCEILQMAILQPQLLVLDETDSGLDIDALKVVAKGVNNLRSENRTILLITHYQRLLSHVVPDKVHVLSGGRIVASGGKDLALTLERKGYAEFSTEAA